MQPVELNWAGGEHPFLLPIGMMRALQDKCDAGPEWVLNRLRTGQWRVDDVVSVIRLGLEGGGMAKEEARKLTLKHVEEQPLTLSVLTAQLVLMASLYDRGDDTVGDEPGELAATGEMSPSVAADGGSAAFTAPAL